MLDDREQRLLDATAELLGREEPELAAHLRDHSLRDHSPTPRRPRRIPLAAWPPLIMFLVCLVLVVLPALLL